MGEQGPRCAESSLEGGEPVWGTANDGVRTWVMVEYAGRWAAKVPKQTLELPEATRGRLLELDDRPDTRVQLIRRPARDGNGPGVEVFVARVDEQGGELWGLSVENHAQLADLEPGELLAGNRGARRLDAPHFFVCTHGTRDACCARGGVPLYTALERLAPEQTWQCSHLGGHRMAPTMLVLPHGVVYGRLPEARAQDVIEAAGRAELLEPSVLRGRSCHPRPVQAAEALVREQTGQLGLGSVLLEGYESPSEGRWEITFDVAGVRHGISVELVTSQQAIYGSCGDEAPKPYTYYRRVVS